MWAGLPRSRDGRRRPMEPTKPAGRQHGLTERDGRRLAVSQSFSFVPVVHRSGKEVHSAAVLHWILLPIPTLPTSLGRATWSGGYIGERLRRRAGEKGGGGRSRAGAGDVTVLPLRSGGRPGMKSPPLSRFFFFLIVQDSFCCNAELCLWSVSPDPYNP
jgi:hypothetical protein